MEVGAVSTIPPFTFPKIAKFNTNSAGRPPAFPPAASRRTSDAQATSFCGNIRNPKCRDLLVLFYVRNVLRNAKFVGLTCFASLSSSTSGGSDGGECREKSEVEESLSAGADVILLDVGGTTCGGCAASVKRILETQPQVSSASVNLDTGTTVVWVVPVGPEVGVTHNWRKELGEKLASQLTIFGFKSGVRVALDETC